MNAPLTPRTPPDEILTLRHAWFRYMRLWRASHYSLGIVGALAATIVAAKPGLLRDTPHLLDGLAWLSVACIAILTTARAHSRANAYAAAWRVLNDACNRYARISDYSIKSLLDAAKSGETIIQKSDPAS